MVAKHVALFACAIGSLMACTTRPDPELAGPTPVHIPPPEVSIDLPLEQQMPRDAGIAQACLLSTAKSCMELDPRPFEACLAGATNCRDKGEGGITLLEAPTIGNPTPRPE